MKRIIFLIIYLTTLCSSQVKAPYEATWLELTKTKNGYIIKNYPAVDGDIVIDEIRIINKIIVTQDSLIMAPYWEGPHGTRLSNIQNLGNESYFFKISNYFKFEWFDKQKHIARWSIYHGDNDDRIMRDLLYIDSVYNTYPIVDCVWHETCDVE